MNQSLSSSVTHAVENQPPPLEPYDLFTSDRALVEAVTAEGAGWAKDHIASFGARLGSKEVIGLGFAANENPPTLQTHDRFGNRIDEVNFHPAWHQMLELSVGAGVHSLAWENPRPGAHVARTALSYMLAQVECGVLCPLTMTFAAVPVLRSAAGAPKGWDKMILSRAYDARFIPAHRKTGALIGMAMTEKQGGSDLRTNSTVATAEAGPGPGQPYVLRGHKWFCSAPMCDAFLTLAQTRSGLSCFFVPRWLDDTTRNAFRIQRLKDKLGNWSNASVEIEYDGTRGWMIGEEGRGIATIIMMAHHTRLELTAWSAGMMRQAAAQAIHHCTHRRAFQKTLIDQPLMSGVLADLALESEAAMALTLRLARAFDEGIAGNEGSHAFARIVTAIAKYWVCKRAPNMIMEAMECLGGGGYIEESIMPRLYREVPMYAIGEGPGNVMCLDVMRAVRKDSATRDAIVAELRSARGADARYDRFAEALSNDLADIERREPHARALLSRLARALQGAALIRGANAAVIEGFCASRLQTTAEGDSYLFGALPAGVDCEKLLARATPHWG
jgi:putative acyl-CoA dehydrogenase